MSLHITRFIDRIKQFESRGAKDFSMPMTDAKDLHGEITKLLLRLEDLNSQTSKGSQTIEIEVRSPGF